MPASPTAELSLWSNGPTRDAIQRFLSESEETAPEDRVAVFDNDGTLWCERPAYSQHEFTMWAVAKRSETDPSFEVPALVRETSGPSIGDVSPQELAADINSIFEGLTPEAFTALVQQFRFEWRHPHSGRSMLSLRYTPMLELLEALRRRRFDVFVVTGGGADFVRSLSTSLYGVTPDRVIGSLVEYHFEPENAQLVRGVDLLGPPNEGEEKVSRMQSMIGRKPMFAAGNSAGDAEMLHYTAAGSAPNLALLVDHDDATREYSYRSVAATLSDADDIVAVGRDQGWAIASIRDDWNEVFADLL